jgi:hypothetical protein
VIDDFALSTTSDPREILARLGVAADQIEPAYRLLAGLTPDVVGYLRSKSGDLEAFMRWLGRELAGHNPDAGLDLRAIVAGLDGDLTETELDLAAAEIKADPRYRDDPPARLAAAIAEGRGPKIVKWVRYKLARQAEAEADAEAPGDAEYPF